ncbi:MAG: hypothetical protein AAGE52_33905 [Myxococcota bacterium]
MTRWLAVVVLVAAGCTRQSVLGRDRGEQLTIQGGVNDDTVNHATVDADGNTYVVGSFAEEILLGDDRHRAGPSGVGAFLLSVDRQGAYRWSRSWSASTFTYAASVAVEGESVYVLGYVGGTLETERGVVDAGTTQDLTMLHFDRAGAMASPPLQLPSRGGNAQGKAVLTTDRHLSIVGHFVGDVDPGDGLLGATGDDDHGLATVFDSAGSLRWAVSVGEADVLLVDGLLGDGSLRAVGHFGAGVLWGNEARGARDGLVAAFDDAGALRWHLVIASDGVDRVDAIASLGDDAVLAAVVEGPVDAAGQTFPAAGGTDLLILRVDEGGSIRWARRIGGELNEFAGDIATTDEDVLVAGSFRGTLELAGEVLTSRGDADAVVFALNADGEPQWVRSLGGPGPDVARGVFVDQRDVVIAGTVSEGAEFNGEPVPSNGGSDLFVLRFRL